MVRPAARSRAMRKIFRRVPSGKVRVFYRRRKKPKWVGSCEICGAKIKRLRGDSRVFGGVLCAACVGAAIGYYTRIVEGTSRLEDVDLRYKKYVEVLLKRGAK